MQSRLPQARELVSQLTLEEKALLCWKRFLDHATYRAVEDSFSLDDRWTSWCT